MLAQWCFTKTVFVKNTFSKVRYYRKRVSYDATGNKCKNNSWLCYKKCKQTHAPRNPGQQTSVFVENTFSKVRFCKTQFLMTQHFLCPVACRPVAGPVVFHPVVFRVFVFLPRGVSPSGGPSGVSPGGLLKFSFFCPVACRPVASSRFCDLLQGQNARKFEGNRFYDSLPSGVLPSGWPSGVSPGGLLNFSFLPSGDLLSGRQPFL